MRENTGMKSGVMEGWKPFSFLWILLGMPSLLGSRTPQSGLAPLFLQRLFHHLSSSSLSSQGYTGLWAAACEGCNLKYRTPKCPYILFSN